MFDNGILNALAVICIAILVSVGLLYWKYGLREVELDLERGAHEHSQQYVETQRTRIENDNAECMRLRTSHSLLLSENPQAAAAIAGQISALSNRINSANRRMPTEARMDNNCHL